MKQAKQSVHHLEVLWVLEVINCYANLPLGMQQIQSVTHAITKKARPRGMLVAVLVDDRRSIGVVRRVDVDTCNRLATGGQKADRLKVVTMNRQAAHAGIQIVDAR